MSNTFKFESTERLNFKRINTILNELDAFCDEFGGSDDTKRYNEKMYELFNPLYMVGLIVNWERPVVGFMDEVPYEKEDEDGTTDIYYYKGWTKGKPKTPKQAGRKIAEMLHRFSDMVEDGEISPEYSMTPEEIDEVADYLKDNLSEANDEDF